MQELLLYLETVLRATLLRFHASPESLKRIFRVTSALYKRYNAQNKSGGKEISANSITDTMLEILSDGLRGKARVPSSTVSSILEVRITQRSTRTDVADACQVVIDPEMDIPAKQLARYAEDGTFYLLSYTPTEHFAQADCIAAETVAKLITLLADKGLVSLINIISGLNAEVRRPWLTCSLSNSPPASIQSWFSRPSVEFPAFRCNQDQVVCGRQSPLLPILALRPLFPTLSPPPHAAKPGKSGNGRRRHKPGLRVNKTLVIVCPHV